MINITWVIDKWKILIYRKFQPQNVSCLLQIWQEVPRASCMPTLTARSKRTWTSRRHKNGWTSKNRWYSEALAKAYGRTDLKRVKMTHWSKPLFTINQRSCGSKAPGTPGCSHPTNCQSLAAGRRTATSLVDGWYLVSHPHIKPHHWTINHLPSGASPVSSGGNAPATAVIGVRPKQIAPQHRKKTCRKSWIASRITMIYWLIMVNSCLTSKVRKIKIVKNNKIGDNMTIE